MRPLALALLLTVPAGAGGASELAPGVHLVRGAFVPGQQPDGNSVLFVGADGIVVVDTGRHVAHTRAVLAEAKALGAPVRAVVNTHWHLDHVGGNRLLRAEVPGVRIHASAAIDGALEGFLADYRRYLEAEIPKTEDAAARGRLEAELGLIQAGRQLAPDEVVEASGRRPLAGRELELHLEPGAVTAGDVWVRDVASGVVVAGDLVTLPVPFLDTACPAGWRQALDRLAAAEFETLVPGHGEPMTRRQFESWRTAFGNLLACAASEAADAACADGWFSDLGGLASDDEHSRAMMAYYLGQHLRSAEATARLCGAS